MNDTKLVLTKQVRLSNRPPYRNVLVAGTVVDKDLLKHLEEDNVSLEDLVKQGLVEEVSVFVPDPEPKGTVTMGDRGLTEADLRKLNDDQLFVVGGENGGEMGHDYEDREECIAFLMCKNKSEGADAVKPAGDDSGEAGSSGSGAEDDDKQDSQDDSPSASEIELETARQELDVVRAKLAEQEQESAKLAADLANKADELHVAEDGAADGTDDEPAEEPEADAGDGGSDGEEPADEQEADEPEVTDG